MKNLFFAYCPESGFEIHETLEGALDDANDRIQGYLDDAWSEEVTGVYVGEITHRAKMCDQVFPDGNVDEDGLDESGEWWDPYWEYKCNYKMLPVERNPAPDLQVEPVAYAVVADNGNIRIWGADPNQVETLRQQYGEALQPLYLHPQPAPEVALVEVLEELIDLMEDIRQGEYVPDSFTTQPARIALATHRNQGGES